MAATNCLAATTPMRRKLAARIESVVPRAGIACRPAHLALLPPTEKKKGPVNKLRRFFEGAAVAPRDIAQYRWMTFLDAGGEERLYSAGFRAALDAATSIGRSATRWARARRRPAQSPAVCRPVHLSVRRHPRQSRSHEHGHVAGNARAVSGCRRDGAGVFDARLPEDPQRRRKFILKQALRGILPDRSSIGRRKASASR